MNPGASGRSQSAGGSGTADGPGRPDRTGLETAVLHRVTPSKEEEAGMQGRVARLEAACRTALEAEGMAGTPTVQGSVAKGTWLSGAADLDCFLLMDPDLPEERLKTVAEAVGPRVLDDARKKYAQHPYLIGTFEDLQVDLVPAYRVPDAGHRMSAVDRTPFHTAWVREHLDEAARGQVRLLKRWCKGVGIYGAETAVGGFSGYLLEVLMHHHGGFAEVLGWFAAGSEPRRIAPGGRDDVDDDVSPLVVVDPVDATRNCAAAVQADILARAQEAAQAYQRAPGERFFFPVPPAPTDAARLHDALATQDATWLGLTLTPRTDRLDIVLPQFQKAGRTLAQGMERAGFPVRRAQVLPFDDEAQVGLQWVLDGAPLPEATTHTGPPADATPHADTFRKKWQGHPDAVGDVTTVDGRLQITVAVPHRTPHEWLRAHLDRLATGKHVRAALDESHRILDDPADAPADWAPRVADFVLDRRPWQRP